MKIPIHTVDETQKEAGREGAAPQVSEGSSEPLVEPVVVPHAEEAVPPDVRVEAVEAALAQKTQEYDATREQLLRLVADFDNYRKRITRQSDEARQFAMADLVSALLPGFDNLQRALNAAVQDAVPSNAAIAEGVRMVLRQFKEALAKVGVHEIQTEGQPFDPTRHEAVDTVRVPASKDGLIVDETQRGYMLNERLLRPAKVVVGKAEGDADPGGT
jgi:molecular chaperone GrpE